MIRYILTFLALILLSGGNAQAQMMPGEQTEPASVDFRHIVDKKVDSTGGIQLPSSFNLYDVNKTLDSVRGPDLMGKCAFFGSSVTDPGYCESLQNAMIGDYEEVQTAPVNNTGPPLQAGP